MNDRHTSSRRKVDLTSKQQITRMYAVMEHAVVLSCLNHVLIQNIYLNQD